MLIQWKQACILILDKIFKTALDLIKFKYVHSLIPFSEKIRRTARQIIKTDRIIKLTQYKSIFQMLANLRKFMWIITKLHSMLLREIRYEKKNRSGTLALTKPERFKIVADNARKRFFRHSRVRPCGVLSFNASGHCLNMDWILI